MKARAGRGPGLPQAGKSTLNRLELTAAEVSAEERYKKIALNTRAAEREQAAVQYRQRGRAARVFQEIFYQTRESWSRARRVIAKAEYLEKGSNPRFVVTSLKAEH